MVGPAVVGSAVIGSAVIGVKICGIHDPAGFDAAVGAGADWIGFNFFPPSPRHLEPAAAARLSARSPGGPARVGLFVDPDADQVARCLDAVALDVLQIHASAERSAELGRQFGLPVWHAFGIAAAADLPVAADGLERLVIEARPPAGATRPGGNAVVMDWRLAAGWAAPCPWLLAGGLTPQNVAEAIRISGARAVDVASGVERAPGIKDPALIRAFIAAARAV